MELSQDMVQGAFIGRSVPRVEDADLVTGRGRFVANLTVPGTLHAVFVRSHFARARLVQVDTRPALGVPGVRIRA